MSREYQLTSCSVNAASGDARLYVQHLEQLDEDGWGISDISMVSMQSGYTVAYITSWKWKIDSEAWRSEFPAALVDEDKNKKNAE